MRESGSEREAERAGRQGAEAREGIAAALPPTSGSGATRRGTGDHRGDDGGDVAPGGGGGGE